MYAIPEMKVVNRHRRLAVACSQPGRVVGVSGRQDGAGGNPGSGAGAIS